MSEKVVRVKAVGTMAWSGMERVVIEHDLRPMFKDGDEVVVIPASEYERLRAVDEAHRAAWHAANCDVEEG